MKRTEVVTLKFCSELYKVWPGGHVLLVPTAIPLIDFWAPWTRSIQNIQPSYTKILTLLTTYIKEIRRTFCTLEKFITSIKFIPNCDIACQVYVKLKVIEKTLTLLQQTSNSVQYLYLLIKCVNVCFIHFHHPHSPFWCTFVTFWTTLLKFWRPLSPSALGSRLFRGMVVTALASKDLSFEHGTPNLRLARAPSKLVTPLLQALRVEIEIKNLNLQATLLLQKVAGTPFPPHYTPAPQGDLAPV